MKSTANGLETASDPKRRLVADRYEVLFELARGGMGVVHAARLVGAHGFDRLVAIKELLGADDDPRARESFLEEARVAAKIHHPNVLPTLELFEHEGAPFIVMELVRGASLWQLLGRYAKGNELPDPDLSAWIIMQAASGLHAAHELCDDAGRSFGLVHRDVSPQNILLGFDGRVCVADFGIAKLRRAGVKTVSGMVKGKFAYMSPEQAQAHPIDRRSDVFSLGIVLHEALTGQRLFAFDSPTETLLHIIDDSVPSPRAKRPDVPEELSAIAMRCLEKSPDRRYATADALSQALRGALRTRRADADEQRLREVLERLLSAQRVALTERLSTVAPVGLLGSPADGGTATVVDASPPVFTADEPDATRFAPLGPPSAPVERRGRAQRVWAAAGVAAALLIVSIAAYLGMRRSPPSHEEPGPVTVATSAAPSAVAAAPPRPDPAPAGSPQAASTALDSAAVPTAAPAGSPSHRATRPRHAPSAAPPVTAPAPSVTAAAPVSSKGAPFRRLDP